MMSVDHPELNNTPILNNNGHKKYQILIGMLNWIVTIGRLDVCYATTSSLARFTTCPRERHLKRAKQVLGYLKKQPNQCIMANLRDPTYLNCEANFEKEYARELQEAYPDACEEVNANIPEPLINEMDHGVCGFGSWARQGHKKI
jgi:hypothetical protein